MHVLNDSYILGNNEINVFEETQLHMDQKQQ